MMKFTLIGILCLGVILQPFINSELISLTTPHPNVDRQLMSQYFEDNSCSNDINNSSETNSISKSMSGQESNSTPVRKRVKKENPALKKDKAPVESPDLTSNSLADVLLGGLKSKQYSTDGTISSFDATMLRLLSGKLNGNPRLSHDNIPGSSAFDLSNPTPLDFGKFSPYDLSVLYLLNNLSPVQSLFSQNLNDTTSKVVPYSLVPFLVKTSGDISSELRLSSNSSFSTNETNSSIAPVSMHNESMFTKPMLELMKTIVEGQKNITSVISQLGNSSLPQPDGLRSANLPPMPLPFQFQTYPEISPIMVAPSSLLQSVTSPTSPFKSSIFKPILLEQPNIHNLEVQPVTSKPIVFGDPLAPRPTYPVPFYPVQPRPISRLYQPIPQSSFQSDSYLGSTQGRIDASSYPQEIWGQIM